jgi:hypothetical protein
VAAVYSRGLKLLVFCFFSFLSLFTQICLAQSGTTPDPEANPGRPTVSTPATLTPVGYLQFENGALFADHSTEFSNRIGIGQVTKLAVLPRVELFLQSEPLAISGFQDQTAVHEGEVFAGAQALLYSGGESGPALAISYTWRIHASVAPELDIGTFRQSTAILFSENLHGFHIDTNGILAEQAQGNLRRAQFGQTLSISHAIGKFTFSGETWHFSQPFQNGHAVGNLWAVSRALRKNLVVDAGFNHGLTDTSTRWEAFLGFTYLLPHRLWMERHGQRP